MIDNAVASCLICGSTDEPTVEHIVPQALWGRLGLDPDHSNLARYRTALCYTHNAATSALHRRAEVLDLITTGEPVTKRSLTQLADWAVWVTLLLGLATGDGVLPEQEARRLLEGRFDGREGGGPPPGIRVYVARVSKYVKATTFVSHMVGVKQAEDILIDYAGRPAGINGMTGPVTASDSIGLNNIAILVLSRTYSSGPGHKARLDAAAKTVGLDLIHPPVGQIPELVPRPIDIAAISQVFVPVLEGTDTSLLPAPVRSLVDMVVPRRG